jgi:YD repeat-containing protein
MSRFERIRFFLIPFILVLIWNCVPCEATINLKRAEYSDRWEDLKIGTHPTPWRLMRQYNSRSLHNGLFGFGWCSDFEHDLHFLPDGNLKFTECGAGSESIYTRVRSRDPQIVRYIADGIGEIELRGGHFFMSVRASSCGECNPFDAQEFDEHGRLLRSSSGMRDYTYRYEGGTLKSISVSKDIQVQLEYYSSGKLRKAVASSGEYSEYWYSSSGDLIKVRTASGNIFYYFYDELHNLTRTEFPNHTFKTITYNTNWDWITGFRDIDGCTERYRYERSIEDPQFHFWAGVERICPTGSFTTSRYEFWLGPQTGALERYLEDRGWDSNDRRYNQQGYVVSVTRGGIVRAFQYDHRTDETRMSSIKNLLVPSVSIVTAQTPLEVEVAAMRADASARRWDRVEESLQKAESLSQSNEELETLNSIAAQLYEERGDLQQAETRYRRLLGIAPNNVAGLSGLARVLGHNDKKLDEAESLASRAIQLKPQDAGSLASLGWILLEKGRLAEAEAYLKKASTLLPTEPLFHEQLGDVFAREGKTQLAIEQWEISRAQLNGDVRSEEEEELLQRVNQNLAQSSGTH